MRLADRFGSCWIRKRDPKPWQQILRNGKQESLERPAGAVDFKARIQQLRAMTMTLASVAGLHTAIARASMESAAVDSSPLLLVAN